MGPPANLSPEVIAHWRDVALGCTAAGQTASPHDLPLYLLRFQGHSVYDPVLAVYDVRAGQLALGDGRQVQLSGEVTSSGYARGTVQMLLALGFEISENEIRVLPERDLGPARFAYSAAPYATMRKMASIDSEQVTGVALGWPLRLLRDAIPASSAPDTGKTEHWYLAQSSDGYVGYVRDDQILRSENYRLPDAVLTAPVAVGESSGQAQLPIGAGLRRQPTGSDYEPAGWAIPRQGQWTPVDVPSSHLRQAVSELSADEILHAAEPLMKTPYFWGGVTEQGIDCSAFTRFIYKALGVYLPRDTRPQSVVGEISAFGDDVERDAGPGDLVFFANDAGRINHIGISLGEGRVIHSSLDRGVNVCGYHEPTHRRPNGLLEAAVFSRRLLLR